jgi:hypothetical protein
MKNDLSETALLEAIENLQRLERKDSYFGEAAGRLRIQLEKILEGDFGTDPTLELLAFAKAVEKSPRRSTQGRKFQTPIFKCLDEHRLCLEKEFSPGICAGLTALCIMRHLVPFFPDSN